MTSTGDDNKVNIDTFSSAYAREMEARLAELEEENGWM